MGRPRVHVQPRRRVAISIKLSAPATRASRGSGAVRRPRIHGASLSGAVGTRRAGLARPSRLVVGRPTARRGCGAAAFGRSPACCIMAAGLAIRRSLDPRFPELLARYARMVAERYPWVDDYTPINEPLTTARFSALYGVLVSASPIGSRFRARAAQSGPRHRAGDAGDSRDQSRGAPDPDRGLRPLFGTWPTRRQAAFENHRRWLTWDLLTGRVDADHPLRRVPGRRLARPQRSLDASAPSDAAVGGRPQLLPDQRSLPRSPARSLPGRSSTAATGGFAMRTSKPCARARVALPATRHLRRGVAALRIPVALTEVHLGCTREEQLRWLHEAWRGARDAAADGVQVVAITPWALLGSYDWDSLVTEARGHYESGAFDVRAARRAPTALVPMIRQLARGEAPDACALAAPDGGGGPSGLLGDEPCRRRSPCGRPGRS